MLSHALSPLPPPLSLDRVTRMRLRMIVTEDVGTHKPGRFRFSIPLSYRVRMTYERHVGLKIVAH